MVFPIPRASVGWQLGVPPEIISLIEQRQHQWVIVQVPGYPPVIYVNCLEGDHLVQVLQKHLPDDSWQEPPVTGGSGGGANHPKGVILLGPEGLEPFRAQLNTPPPPHNVLRQGTKAKLSSRTLRLVPPTTYLKMCRAYKKKSNAYKSLRVVGPGPQPRSLRSVAHIFKYRSLQVPSQQQHQAATNGTPAAALPPPATLKQQAPSAHPPPSSPQVPTPHTLQAPTAAAPMNRYSAEANRPPPPLPAAECAPATSRADMQPAESFFTALPKVVEEGTATSTDEDTPGQVDDGDGERAAKMQRRLAAEAREEEKTRLRQMEAELADLRRWVQRLGGQQAATTSAENVQQPGSDAEGQPVQQSRWCSIQ